MNLITSTSHLDRFGYYEVNGQRYLHKLTAYQAADFNIKNVKFVFNDSVFESYDWTRDPEPDTALSEFYRRRAQALRDKYEYLVLMYSGGPDSRNMLDAFIRHNIPVDEIVNFNSYERTRLYQDTINNADYVYNAQPVLDALRVSNPEIRITVADEIDMSQRYQKRLQARGDFELVFGVSGCMNHFIFRGVWVREDPRIWNMLQSGIRVGVVIGHDKPRILVSPDNRYYTQFIDINCTDTALNLSESPDLRDLDFYEFFYQGPDSVPLIIKQSHVLKNFMDSVQDLNQYEDQETHDMRKLKRLHFTCLHKDLRINLKYAKFHELIYPNSTVAFRTVRPYLGFSTRHEDTWWRDQLDPDITAFWYKGLYKAIQFAKISHNSQNGPHIRGLPYCFSKPMYLE
jgi:hypothetical protein